MAEQLPVAVDLSGAGATPSCGVIAIIDQLLGRPDTRRTYQIGSAKGQRKSPLLG